MRDLSRYDDAVAAIDAANAADPTSVLLNGVEVPLALAHGRLAVVWIERLVPHPHETVLLAARAHHLLRWELPRSTYPDGRAGYLRWRGDQKKRHARDVGVILAAAGYEAATIERVQSLIKREGLGSDPDTQAVEDAACLVFAETQLIEVAVKLPSDRLANVLRKTFAKMSPSGRAALARIDLPEAERRLVDDLLNG